MMNKMWTPERHKQRLVEKGYTIRELARNQYGAAYCDVEVEMSDEVFVIEASVDDIIHCIKRQDMRMNKWQNYLSNFGLLEEPYKQPTANQKPAFIKFVIL